MADLKIARPNIEKVDRTPVAFRNEESGLMLAGILYRPRNRKEGEKLPAIVVGGPMLSAKELVQSLYAQLLAEQGYLTMVYLGHSFLHLKWWKAVFKGKYSPYRICLTATNVVLLVLMLLQPLSGIAVSKHLYTSLPLIGIASQARSIHMAAAYWCYVLMSFHLGLHIDGMMRGIYRKTTATAKWIARVLIWGVSVYGM
ncbi:MAG: DUF4405 domain-containing protein [Clostridium sp.]|nr:DUF4405 domain-containing protein [Clostridium sp.]